MEERIILPSERLIRGEESNSFKDKELNEMINGTMGNNQSSMSAEQMALMIQEVERLKSEKLVADETIVMKQKLSKAAEALEQLRNLRIELEKFMREPDLVEDRCRLVEVRNREEVERLAREKLEADKALDEMKKKLSKADETLDQVRSVRIEHEKLTREHDLLKEKFRLVERKSKQEVERLKSEKLAGDKALNEMKRRLSEADRTVEYLRKFEFEHEKLTREHDLLQEKFRLVELKSKQEVEKLKSEKLAGDNALNEMKRRLSEADQTVEYLRKSKFENEKLIRERDLSEEKYRLAELRIREAEHEKFKFLQDVQKRNQEDRNQEGRRKLVLRVRLKRADEMRSQITNEKKPVISELKGQIMQNNPVVTRAAQMKRKVERLSVEETLCEMKQKLSKTDGTVKQLSTLDSEFSETIKDSRWYLPGTCGTSEETGHKQLIDYQASQELKVQCSEVSKTIEDSAELTIEELRRLNLEASNTIDQLIQRLSRYAETIQQMRFRQEKTDKAMEDLKRRCSEGNQKLDKVNTATTERGTSSSPAAKTEEVANNNNIETLKF